MAVSDLQITSDTINQAGSSEQYNLLNVLVGANIRRAFVIEGLSQYSTPASALADARARVLLDHPIGEPSAQNSSARLQQLDAMPIDGSDDAATVVASYIYSQIPWDSTQWAIETDTWGEMVEVDNEYTTDGSGTAITLGNGLVVNVRPIVVDNYYLTWDYFSTNTPPQVRANPADPNSALVAQKPFGKAVGTAQVYRPRKRLVMTRTIYSQTDYDNLEAMSDSFVGYLNNATFRGKPLGTWLCMDVDLNQQPYAGSRIARLEFLYRPESWLAWSRYSNAALGGVPPNVFKFAKNGGPGNGYKQANVYLGNDFNRLVNAVTGTPGYFPGNGGVFPTGSLPPGF